MSTMSLRFLLLVSVLVLCFVCSSRNAYAEQPSESQHSIGDVVPVTSLLPSNVCHRLPEAVSSKASFEVVNTFGPCSDLSKRKSIFSKISLQDQSRIEFFRARRRNSLQKLTIPTMPGPSIGSLNYLIKFALGTPKQYVSLELDTGSSYTWTRCQPCPNGRCYKQVDPVFNPAKSKSYKNISCSSSICKQFRGTCSSSSKACLGIYGYLDGSAISGIFAKETLTITSVDKTSVPISDYEFLCAYDINSSTLDSADGIMGLDRSRSGSFVAQTLDLYKGYFSYCLPSYFGDSTGYITFGKTKDSTNKKVKFTPITTDTEYYDIQLTGLSVDGKKLPIPSSVFQKGECSIDSGTVITRLPAAANAVLKSAFRKKMSKYKTAKPSDPSVYDTCYDLSHYDDVAIPKISMFFKGNVELKVPETGIFIPQNGLKEMCLAFAGNLNETIIGNYQQQGIEVHYDVVGRRIGFGARRC